MHRTRSEAIVVRTGRPSEQRTTFGGLSRSALMARVRSKGNATTELRLLALLRESGMHGWRRHVSVVGRPDFTWPHQRVAVFLHGCFWHGHRCGRNLVPRTNAAAWRTKIVKNQRRDRRTASALRRAGWTVLTIWECRLARNPRACLGRIRRVLWANTKPEGTDGGH